MRSDLFDDFTEPSDWTPVASGPALIREYRISQYLSARRLDASPIEKSPLLPGRPRSGSKEKALTSQGPYDERASGVEPATSSLGS